MPFSQTSFSMLGGGVYRQNSSAHKPRIWASSHFLPFPMGTGTQSLRDDADWPATVTKQVRYGIGFPGSCIPGDWETGSVTKRGERRVCVCLCVCVSHLVMSDSLWPHGLYPTRLLCPWDSPGKNNGVSCHILLQSLSLPTGNWKVPLPFLQYSGQCFCAL